MSTKIGAVFMACVALVWARGFGASGESSAKTETLSRLVGDWDLTVFVIGGGQFEGLRCGNTEKPGRSPVTIAPPAESGVSLVISCDNGNDYAFRLKHDPKTDAYLITVKSKEGISVDAFPVGYVDDQGWKGTGDQPMDGKGMGITAAVAPIEGRNWYGWRVAVLPTAGVDGGPDAIKRHYIMADLTRPK
jgi:hypothetical protein